MTPSPVSDGHNGYLVNIGDIPRYVERCIHLHRHSETLRAMSLNASATIEKRFNREAMITAYLNLFEAAGANSQDDNQRRGGYAC